MPNPNIREWHQHFPSFCRVCGIKGGLDYLSVRTKDRLQTLRLCGEHAKQFFKDHPQHPFTEIALDLRNTDASISTVQRINLAMANLGFIITGEPVYVTGSPHDNDKTIFAMMMCPSTTDLVVASRGDAVVDPYDG